jgi:hypothetical protein
LAQHRPYRAHRNHHHHHKSHVHPHNNNYKKEVTADAEEVDATDALPVLDADITCECGQDGTHDKEQQAVDTIIEASLPVIFKTLFGTDTAYMTRFHTNDQKNKRK